MSLPEDLFPKQADIDLVAEELRACDPEALEAFERIIAACTALGEDRDAWWERAMGDDL